MPSLLTNSEISQYQSAMQDLHDTFARDIAIYQTSSKTVISTNIQHNFLYNSGPNQTETEDVIIKGIYKARIHYPKEAKLAQMLGKEADEQMQLKRKAYKVKIIVDSTVKDILQKCERIEFDDIIYAVDSDPYPHGVIGVQFWDFYLQSNN